MNARTRFGRAPAWALAALGFVASLQGAARAQDGDAALYRIFLANGETLVSYGEFARVGDRVVFSMPMGEAGAAGTPPLQLVSLPAAAVDWPTTDRYVTSVRAARYAATRGDADFGTLSTQVAWALNEIALTPDPARRLALARQARRLLTDWNGTSYGYRANDIDELLGFVDQILSEIRAAGGGSRFELSFVASVGPPPTMPLLPRPTLKESVEQALTAARLSSEPAERVRLLRSALAIIDAGTSAGTKTWATAARARAVAGLASETQIEQAYATLHATTLLAATSHAANANVRGLEALIRRVLTADDELGHRRPNEISALLATLDVRLAAARRLRLARDKWALEVAGYRAYRKQLSGTLDTWRRIRPALEDVRSLAGPDPDELARAGRRVGQAIAMISLVEPPGALRPVHAMLVSAFQLASNACRLRGDAVVSGDMPTAWNASSAAAGALMLFERADRGLERALKPPELQ